MLNRKQELKLNSYKIDTSTLQASLRELSQIKSQLQTTISHYKTQEDQLLLENQRLKQQISMLQKKTMDKATSSEWQVKYLRIEDQLKETKKQIDKIKLMYESEKRLKDKITTQYENKLQKHIRQNKLQAENYQQRLIVLNIQLKQTKITLEASKQQANRLKQTSKQLRQTIQQLKQQNASLKQQGSRLRKDNADLKSANSQLFKNQKQQNYSYNHYSGEAGNVNSESKLMLETHKPRMSYSSNMIIQSNRNIHKPFESQRSQSLIREQNDYNSQYTINKHQNNVENRPNQGSINSGYRQSDHNRSESENQSALMMRSRNDKINEYPGPKQHRQQQYQVDLQYQTSSGGSFQGKNHYSKGPMNSNSSSSRSGSDVNFGRSPNFGQSPKQYKTDNRINNSNYSYTAGTGLGYYTSSNLPQGNQLDEELFQAQIRKLYHEIKDIGIEAKEIKVLPQFKKLSNNQNPSRKDLFSFFKNAPFEEKDDNKINKSLNYIENSLKNKYGFLNGNHVTQMIIARVEQYQNSSRLNTEQLQISDTTPSGSKTSLSYTQNEGQDSHAQKSSYEQYQSWSRPSIQQNLKSDSEHSFF